MGTQRTSRRVLPAAASSVGVARRLVGEALSELDVWRDSAQLAVSELVTNALVHAGTSIEVRVTTTLATVRVEVSDGSVHLPAPRHYSSISGTGRGLHLVEEETDRWGVDVHESGKTVWFELGSESNREPGGRPAGRGPTPRADSLVVELVNFPLLMHRAWQEHASALLREFLLVHLEDDAANAFERHAQASDAMNLLHEQAPAPRLAEDPEAIMASAVEPDVSAARVSLTVPHASLPNFQTLDDMLSAASTLALEGALLVPAVQPEVQEMRQWICSEVRRQGAQAQLPLPWSPDTDATRQKGVPSDLEWDDQEITGSHRALIATDETSIIVAVSASAVNFLRYDSAEDLVGRRIIRIVPARYHQAHIAGTTMHMLNGRDALLGVRITVPVTKSDDSEEPVALRVEPRRLPNGHHLFIAELFLEALENVHA